MTHRHEQAHMFFLLERIDYSQDWKDIEYDLGYDLGDHRFTDDRTYRKVVEAAKNLWVVLNGYLTEHGEVEKDK